MKDPKDYKALVTRLRSEARCYPDDCEYCSAEGKCKCQRIGEACDAIESLLGLLGETETDLKVCRNELCLKCGNYSNAHLGWCNGCRWQGAG
jgi:hypothetical protein